MRKGSGVSERGESSGERRDSERQPPLPTDDDEDDVEPGPPLPLDGGWGWVVVIGSLFCNIIVDGVCFSFGIFYPVFLDYYKESRGKTAIVGSLIPGMYLGMGPVVSALANKFGCRTVTMVGAVIASISFFISTFSPNVDVLIFTYGILGGMGFGLMYLPAIVIVGFYFEQKRALATGLAVCGSGIGTFIFAPFATILMDNYGWQGSYWIISGIILNGVVCGALFRPLEATPIRKKKGLELEDLKSPPRGTIMNKIIEEKKRMRTISTGSLDGSVITRDNTLIKDPEKIKNIKNLTLAPLDEVEEEETTGTVPNGHTSQSIQNSTVLRLKDEARSFRPPAPLPPPAAPLQPPPAAASEPAEPTSTAEPTIVSDTNKPSIAPDTNKDTLKEEETSNSAKDLVTSTKSLTGMFPSSRDQGGWLVPKMRDRANSETWRQRKNYRVSRTGEKVPLTDDSPKGSKLSLSPTEIRAKQVARPMYRKDIFYGGSVTSLREFKSQNNMASYIASHTSIPPEEESSGGSCGPLCSVLKEMLDLSLLKSPTFMLLCVTSILAMTGFFTPFVYMTDNATQLGVNHTNAAFLLSLLGLSNTFGRILCGWVSDRPWADCLIIHNVALIIAGASTCIVPLLQAYWLLCIYCIVFGGCIAAFITLRSIVLVELLGLQKLTSSFGLLLLFQGIASLIGSPLAGAIYDATKSYKYSFIVSGAFIALAGLIALPVRRVAAWEERRWGSMKGPCTEYVRVDPDDTESNAL